jgi:hypothetical protein
MNNDRAVYESLLRLAKRLEMGHTDLPSICRWVMDYTELPAGYVQRALFPHFETWCKFSGDLHYPVTIAKYTNPEKLYNSCRHSYRRYWDITTQYGANRRELLIHLIHHLLLKIHADEEARADIRINL